MIFTYLKKGWKRWIDKCFTQNKMAASREELKTIGISPPSGKGQRPRRQGSCAKLKMAHTLSNKTANFPGLVRGMHDKKKKRASDDRWPRNPHGVDLRYTHI